MTIYIEVVKAKNDDPVKGAKVVLQYANGVSKEGVTPETGVAEFEQGGVVSISVNGQIYQSQIKIDDDETVTVALDKPKAAKLKRLKKIHLHSVNGNPLLPANQPNQRQASLHVQAPMGKLKRQKLALNISLVIDCGSSMMGDKIYYATEAAIEVLKQLTADDHVSVITFSRSPELVLPARQLNNEAREALIARLRHPTLGENSNLSAGWQAGAGQLLDHKNKASLNRVFLFTDGQLDTGITGLDELVENAGALQRQDVYTYTFGVGAGAGHALLQAIAEAGQGSFHVIEQPNELSGLLKKPLNRLDADVQLGHQASIRLTVPQDIQIAAMQAGPYARQGPDFTISLGEIYARQQKIIPLMIHLPPYPAGHQVMLPVALHYHDAQTLLPVTARAMPLNFTVVDSVREESSKTPDSRPAPQPAPQPAPRWWANPVFAVLSGGALFVLLAFLAVGTLLLLSPRNEPVDTAAGPPPPVEAEVVEEAAVVVEPTGVLTPATVTLTPTPVPVTNTPTVIAIDSDKITLPTKTPTPRPTRTPTATPAPVPQPAKPAAPVEGLQVGNLAPDFTIGNNLFNRVSLSELRGKGVIINFWASWCGACRWEVAALEAIHNEYGPQGVVVLIVNQGESLETVEKFAWDNGLHFTFWLDEDRWAGNIYRVRAIPTSYFIDPDGIIRQVHIGAMTEEFIAAQLPLILPEKK